MLSQAIYSVLCYCKIALWLFIRPTGKVFVEVDNAACQREGRRASTPNVSFVMILLAGVLRESEEIDGNSGHFKTLRIIFLFFSSLVLKIRTVILSN